jgi:hypothetical protein
MEVYPPPPCNPSTWEAEAGRAGVQGQPVLHSDLKNQPNQPVTSLCWSQLNSPVWTASSMLVVAHVTRPHSAKNCWPKAYTCSQSQQNVALPTQSCERILREGQTRMLGTCFPLALFGGQRTVWIFSDSNGLHRLITSACVLCLLCRSL